jgi:ELWxxDGT repeat protein
MRKNLLLAIIILLTASVKAQITQINSNKSLTFEAPLNTTKAIFVSGIDNTPWVSDGTAAGTFQLSSTIQLIRSAGILNGKLIFEGNSVATGNELFITDGTPAGTMLLKDIYTGVTGSDPGQDYAQLNGFIYFTAQTAAEGRELWRTDGTPNGTTLVKDIIPGPASSNAADGYNLFSNGSYLLFDVSTVTTGNELWKSDGTAGGTQTLKDINLGPLPSNPDNFSSLNNLVLFVATDVTHGTEVWKTDGTANGTQLLKDINPGILSSMNFGFFNVFNGKAYFAANDGTHGDELWVTDGTTGNTNMVKDINPGAGSSMSFFFSQFPLGDKFLFQAADGTHGIELWQSDGTTAGTQLFKDIAPGPDSSYAFVLPSYSYDITTNTLTYPLFKGNKFFIIAKTPALGFELYISDGTPGGTTLVKDINPGPEDGALLRSFIYTSNALYFTGDDGVHGQELWQSDGTAGGTFMVENINPQRDEQNKDENSDVSFAFMIINKKVIFGATNGDDPNATDLYVLNGDFSSLPLTLGEFTVTPKNADAYLQWSTLTEINTKNFTVQRSDDGGHFTDIGLVAAAGTSTSKLTYNFTDKEIMNSGKETVYYRILTTDKDGRTTDSKIIALKLKAGEWTVKLISNLVKTDLDVLLAGVTHNVKISVKDISGKTVGATLSTITNGHISVPVNSITPGLYVLIVESNNDRRIFRFIKQ